MKSIISLTAAIFVSISTLVGQDRVVLGEVGYTEQGKTARAVMHRDVVADDSYTYLDLLSGYSIVLKNEDREAFAELIISYQDHETDEMISLGKFTTHAVTGVTTVENVTAPGTYETTYQKGTEIELKYDGEEVWIFIPETKFLRYTAPPLEVRIFKDYTESFYDAYNQ